MSDPGGQSGRSIPSDPRGLKMVLCTRDLDAARRFYVGLLGLRVVEEWDQAEGRGCNLDTGAGLLELNEVAAEWPAFDPAFAQAVANDKILLQLRVDSARGWAERLDGRWPHEGVVDRPWGHRYCYLRDPDGMLVALYEVLPGHGGDSSSHP